MNKKQFLNLRLSSQLLVRRDFDDPAAVVSHFGAMQAQDYQMTKWAVGSRMKKATDEQIESAIDEGKVIRTHILRPTWHLVAAKDIRWMLMISAPSVMRQMTAMNGRLELDQKTFDKSNAIIQRLLSGNNHLTRAEIMAALSGNGINTHGHRSAHLMFHAELSGLVCNGARKGRQSTYALLDERVPEKNDLQKEEALAELAKRYFTSHGPATVKDFIWWSGLPVADVRTAVALNPQLGQMKFEGEEYFFAEGDNVKPTPQFLLLPAFDEYLIAYKERSAMIDLQHSPHAFTKNGIFRPLIVVDGKVEGIWQRTHQKDLNVELKFFDDVAISDVKFANEIKRLERFFGTGIILKSTTCPGY